MPGCFSTTTRWIWFSAEVSSIGIFPADEWVMFRRSISVPQDCQSAVLRITAGFFYVAYVNGHLVGRGPGRSYQFSKTYNEIDVFPWLAPGSSGLITVVSLAGDHAGLLAELVLTSQNEASWIIGSDATWKAAVHSAFTRDTAGYAIPHGREEQFDAQLELPGWNRVDFDDSNWGSAVELGSEGLAPWLSMEKSEIGGLSEDPIFPRSFAAIELVRLRSGYRFRLYAPSECMKVFTTEISCAAQASFRLHFKSGEPKVTLDGRLQDPKSEIHLTQGTYLLCCCQLGYGAVELEFLLETSDPLVFSAKFILAGEDAEWAVYPFTTQVVAYPWHETAASLVDTNPEVSRLMAARSALDLRAEFQAGFQPAIRKEPSAYLDVITQQYFRIPGGYTHPAIERGQPRQKLASPVAFTLQKPNNLLHQHAEAAVLWPTPGFDAHFVVDFGRETLGYLQMMVDAPAGTILDVQCFELIDGRGIAWMENHNGFRYTCREGVQTFTSFYRRGFRYVSVTARNFDRPVKFYALNCLQNIYPVQEVGSFECSDWQLNQIYRMSLNTAALCMVDTYVDCPGHEQNFWVGDARITARINLLTFGAYDLNQRSIRLVGQSLTEAWVKEYWPEDERYTTGRYLPIAAFPNYPEGSLPMWTFLWVIQCWEHYLYGGNLADLNENYGYVTETLRRCQRLTNERGLLDIPGAWNLIEWGNNDLSPYGEVTANNVLLVACLEKAAEMAQALGFEKDAQEYRTEALRRKEIINRLCWDEQRSAYVDTIRDDWAYQQYVGFSAQKGWTPISYPLYCSASRISEQTNTLALISGCVPQDREAAVWQIAQRSRAGHYQAGAPFARIYGSPTDQEAPGGIVAVGSPFFLFFTLEAFFRQKDGAGALEIMLRDWGKMAERGTQTCWETFEYNEKNWTRSVAHAWSAAPAVYLPEQILGIRAIEPGYRKFFVEPVAGHLRWARGSVVTPYGPIFVEWKIDSKGELDITVSAPDECFRQPG